jgi:hypothetical protein
MITSIDAQKAFEEKNSTPINEENSQPTQNGGEFLQLDGEHPQKPMNTYS